MRADPPVVTIAEGRDTGDIESDQSALISPPRIPPPRPTTAVASRNFVGFFDLPAKLQLTIYNTVHPPRTIRAKEAEKRRNVYDEYQHSYSDSPFLSMGVSRQWYREASYESCLLYTSDAAEKRIV